MRIIEDALKREVKEGNGFREADSLLVFEVSFPRFSLPSTGRDQFLASLAQLSWLYLSQARFVETADAMERMCTYVELSAFP